MINLPSVDAFILFSFLGAALVYEAALTALRGKTLGKLITRSTARATIRAVGGATAKSNLLSGSSEEDST